jgi:hypothetical protein
MNFIANDFIKHERTDVAEPVGFGVTDCDLGRVLVARTQVGVCAILLGTNAEELELELAKLLPAETFVRNERAVNDDLSKVFAARPSNARSGMRSAPFRRVARLPSHSWRAAFQARSRSERSGRPAPTIRSRSPFPVTA